MYIKKLADIFVFIIFSLTLLFSSIFAYIKYLWPEADFEQFFYTMRDLTPDIIQNNIYPKDIFYGLLLFILIWPFAGAKLKTKQQLYTSLFLILCLVWFSGYPLYIYYQQKTSDLYEKEYVDPKNIAYEFPEKKRNLILIFLESFEQNFTQPQHYQKNLLPHLQSLQTKDNHALEYTFLNSTNYSIAALVAAHCGIPLHYKENTDIHSLRYFLPQATCFPEILKQQNYQTKIIKAADITFTRADIFTLAHGYTEAWGVNELQQKYPELKEPQYQGTFDGLSDRALFTYAKKEIQNFSSDKPFMLTLFSLDTHLNTYYEDSQCKKYFNDLRDVYLCTDEIVDEFISWLKQSPYWQNTTVVIIGDHLLPARIPTIGRPHRGIYNVFLNTPPELHINPHKKFTTLDLTPTILESLNIKLPQHSFGLGRSLFADTPTLIEKMGNTLKTQLQQNSQIYDKFNTPPVKQEITYIPYTLGTTLNSKEIITYTDSYEELFNQFYLDKLNFFFTSPINTDISVELTFNALLDKGNFITIKANNTEILKYSPQKNAPIPHTISFTIPQQLIPENKLSLLFHNNKGITSAIQMGISPLSIRLSAK